MRISRSGSRALLLAAAAALTVATVPLVTVVFVPGFADNADSRSTSIAAAGATPSRFVPPTEPAKPATGATSAAPQPTVAEVDAVACVNGRGGKRVLVSITEQRAWFCDGAVLTSATPVTTGADVPDRRTRAGTWQIQGKQTHRWLGGPGYSVQVDYWMPYDGDFGFHDADWQTMPFGSADWRTQGSHGCVHFPHAAMAELYAWAPVGTTVTIEA